MNNLGISLILFLTFSAAPSLAEEQKPAQEIHKKAKIVLHPELDRRPINPEEIDSGDVELGFFYGLMNVEDFGTDNIIGARIAYHITEDFFIESTFGQTTVGETSFERLSGSAPILTDKQRDLKYYNLGIGYNVLPGEVFVGSRWAYSSALYLFLGAGSTDFANDNRFTVAYGVGYQVLFLDWFALHIDMRDHMFDIDLLGEEKSTHNLEFHTGLTIYF
jgi:outer membrane beta-barrel protein